MIPVLDDSKIPDLHRTPLQAEMDPKAIAKEAVREALAEYRQEQKRGRSDTGSGSERLAEIAQSARWRFDETQDFVAGLAGVHPTTIGKIETGDRGMSIQTFAKLAMIYDERFIDEVIEYFSNE